MSPVAVDPELCPIFGPLPEHACLDKESALNVLWGRIMSLREAVRYRRPLDPPRHKPYGVKRRKGPIKDFGAKWSALKSYCRLWDMIYRMTHDILPAPRSPREAELICRHMCLYLSAGWPYTTYGQYLRVQKYKKDLEEVREKLIRLYEEREEEEKATWARINAILEKYEQCKK